MDAIRVQLEDGREYTALVIGSDPKTDVAGIQIEVEQSLDAVTIANSELLRTGDMVFAIGSPLGQSQTVTRVSCRQPDAPRWTFSGRDRMSTYTDGCGDQSGEFRRCTD